MACGVPVVSTDCRSGPAEILENGKFGELVQVGDAISLSQAILKGIEKKKCAEYCRKLVERSGDFSTKSIVKNENIFVSGSRIFVWVCSSTELLVTNHFQITQLCDFLL